MDNKQRIKSRKLLEQRVLFDGMNYCLRGKTRVPITDIDGIMDAEGKGWIVYECKHKDSIPEGGQQYTFENLYRDISKIKPIAIFVCSHDVSEDADVYLKDCIVTLILCNGKWIDPIKEYGKELTAKEWTDKFLQKYVPNMIIKW